MAVRKRPAVDSVTGEPVTPDIPDAPEASDVTDTPATSTEDAFSWDDLLSVVEVESVAVRPSPVEVPSAAVELLRKLDQPGPEGGRQRGRLPVSSDADFREKRRVLQAAVNQMGVPRSVSTFAVYAPADLVAEEYETSSGKPRKRTVPRVGAVPTHIAFTVGERRGRKT